MPSLVRPYKHEEAEISKSRLKALEVALPASLEKLNSEDLSVVRELFGITFLTNDYYLSENEIMFKD
jgi:hypothetical protein